MVIVLNEEKKIQKNRFFRKPKKPKLDFGDFGLITKNEGRIELIQLTFFKKLVKGFIKKKKSNIDVIREKIWYFGRPNFLIQTKSKNSRMGKGKGMIERKVIRIRRGVVLFEFLGVSPLRLKKLANKVNKICSVKFCVIHRYKIYLGLWSKLTKYSYYHDKYLYQ